ncbi:hypothetical protein HHK36_032025 [Tetracentron sinense]|uniref:Pentatricopeptide repeat-containing protein n=1 Tax=Tetracentron sinense TaxID=13715 RepID=A0A835CZY0_TETSI|nr:hypothetical protein HHK36_032025 [Tetracentron sinense]
MAMFRRRKSSFTNTNLRRSLLSFHTQPKPQPTNSKIKELVLNGHFISALELYSNLFNHHGFKPDNFTFPYILKAASQLKDPTIGLLIHGHAIRTGFDSNLFVSNSLILFYGQFGNLEAIHYLFVKIPQRNIVTWTAVLSAYTQNKLFKQAIELFRTMLFAGTRPNSFTMATLIPIFGYGVGSTQIHGFSIKCGFESDIFVATALIDAYAKCGAFFSAGRVFREMPEKNIVSWNTMISGCNQNGYTKDSLQLFMEMQKSNSIQPDSFSVVTVLCCCSSLASMRHGKEIHGYVYKATLEGSVLVGNGLIDMYGKCGALDLAELVFSKMQERDVSSWTALINCYGLHGKGAKAISIFEKMKQNGDITPNSVTLIALLSACSHSFLIEDGFRYFKAMSCDYGIEPNMKHYVCMVDMLGRVGLLAEALQFINEMPIPADARVWEALLGAATIRGDTTTAEMAAKCLMELESEDPDLHVQLANTYADAGQWGNVAKIRERMQSRRFHKNPGLSSIQIVQ